MTRDCPTGWGGQRREAIVERERGEVIKMGRELQSCKDRTNACSITVHSKSRTCILLWVRREYE